MSVRDGLLALLTLGPAYGRQLHAELLDRAAHRPRINVGQIYSTLDRLRERGLVADAGSTEDGLPLHTLTEEGRAEALAWLSGEGACSDEGWDDVLDRVLLASSLSLAHLRAVLAAYDRVLSRAAGDAPRDEPKARATSSSDAGRQDEQHPQRRLAARATQVREEALRHLLIAAREELVADADASTVRGFALERPRRGRRAGPRDETGTGAVA
ncbi:MULTISPECIES: PadR family transcriptional regulator [unclassified Rathayibacter]|uniref:PadR family transcriptional regulator n=1 Tax=unclassified Rathayibacter TaxID=2609250 RepID=UPI00188C0F1B|nr:MULTISPECIES: PadR family transcriptional regulator [unclassified Rathayibacter]MBF4462098.1 PadR family transcriptional regulator [Rathayibacter sp. VKM Ac-2879]MBF4503859.1 PadR family transcriptional regulator [Rathayibacter sp. VKM Ac-2878]